MSNLEKIKKFYDSLGLESSKLQVVVTGSPSQGLQIAGERSDSSGYPTNARIATVLREFFRKPENMFIHLTRPPGRVVEYFNFYDLLNPVTSYPLRVFTNLVQNILQPLIKTTMSEPDTVSINHQDMVYHPVFMCANNRVSCLIFGHVMGTRSEKRTALDDLLDEYFMVILSGYQIILCQQPEIIIQHELLLFEWEDEKLCFHRGRNFPAEVYNMAGNYDARLPEFDPTVRKLQLMEILKLVNVEYRRIAIELYGGMEKFFVDLGIPVYQMDDFGVLYRSRCQKDWRRYLVKSIIKNGKKKDGKYYLKPGRILIGQSVTNEYHLGTAINRISDDMIRNYLTADGDGWIISMDERIAHLADEKIPFAESQITEKLCETLFGVNYVAEDIVVVVVTNPTPNPDGSRRRFVLTAHPLCRTARQAVGRSWGLHDGIEINFSHRA